MTYTIVGTPQSRAFRVIWMMEELALPYQIDPVQPASAEAKAINPSGKIPALVDGDTVLIDSMAICQFLADRHDSCSFPPGTVERAAQDAMVLTVIDEIEGPLWTHAKHSFALPEELRVAAAKTHLEAEFQRGLSALDRRLGDGPFAMGERFTVPDILLGHCGLWAKGLLKWEIPAGRLKTYFRGLTERPAYRRAQEAAAKALA
ncbi:MAG: glutathione S-transferase family protein [Pseudomonadota bacterium]